MTTDPAQTPEELDARAAALLGFPRTSDDDLDDDGLPAAELTALGFPTSKEH